MVVTFLRRLLTRSGAEGRHTAPRCRRCGQALVWRKAHLFRQPDEADAAARARFQTIRGEWYCPTCAGEG